MGDCNGYFSFYGVWKMIEVLMFLVVYGLTTKAYFVGKENGYKEGLDVSRQHQKDKLNGNDIETIFKRTKEEWKK